LAAQQAWRRFNLIGNHETPAARFAPSAKIERRPNERFVIGDRAANQGQRTRLLIDRRADPARAGYYAAQSGRYAGKAHLSLRAADVHGQAGARPRGAASQADAKNAQALSGARPFIDTIDNRILTGDL